MTLALKQFKEWGAQGGKIGGRSKTARKRKSSKLNGAKGGRPPKNIKTILEK